MQQQIRLSALVGRLGDAFQTDSRAQFPFANLIDRAVTDCSPQPPGRMGCAFNPGKLLIQLQKYILREFLSTRPVAYEAKGETEHHRLVVPHQLGEIKPHICYYGRVS
jgi:hypothetical protein